MNVSELFGYGQLAFPEGHALDGVPFVVIDLETTGLEPAEDRIIEIAMGRVENGQLVDEWATLLSADRDPGPVFLHHISERMLDGAPTFRDMAGEILSRLDGAVVVAHHAPFEESFLVAELNRIGVTPAPLPAICTRQLAKAVLASPNYKLATCCEICGITITDAHTALGDVRATALLLTKLLHLAPDLRYPVPLTGLPRVAKRATPRTRVTNLRKGTDGWMRSLLSKLPFSMADHDPVGAAPYLDALTEALADGATLTKQKTRHLGRLAGRAGMGARQVAELHRRFLDGLRDVALADDVVTLDELAQMSNVAMLLEHPGYFADITPHETVRYKTGPRVWCGPAVPDAVKRRFEGAGYQVVANISRGLTACVTEYPDDGLKARKARELGVKLLDLADVDAFLASAKLPAPVAPAGWYADPTGRYTYRFWTGELWTEHASPGDGSTVVDYLR
ncbi:exonuclease domain-containing protein [Catelliglobosispora koreensis]|uniref:exonuclease domain-containing protein n=1 Tax=Catelliglobosispora koreensis TaxID=129052 RepID=UPI00037DA9B8|nr:exonuclease domain-containing protein [Catelliglobosispora koreensis]